MSEKQAALAAWARAHGFVPTRDSDEYWELAYGHTIGYGYITIRVSGRGRFGYDVIAETSSACGVHLGVCRTLEQLGAAVECLAGLDYDKGQYAEAQR